jgi:hypothetical protein
VDKEGEMDISLSRLTRFFGICFLLAVGLLMIWFFMYLAAGDLAYSIHAKLFNIDRSLFESMNYYGMAIFKMLSWTLFLIPYIALKIMGKGKGQST